jgi:hypothetical protein
MIYDGSFQKEPIHFKGELRDVISFSTQEITPRLNELIYLYESNPDFFYKEAPVNGVIYLGKKRQFLGFYRIKRPRRIAEKANRYIENWIFKAVQDGAGPMPAHKKLAENIAKTHNLFGAPHADRKKLGGRRYQGRKKRRM